MIELLIHDALTTQIAEIVAAPLKLRSFFLKNRSVTPEVFDMIRTAFLARPPEVFHQYPRLDQFPPNKRAAAWNIVLAEEMESMQPLGDATGVVGLLDEGGGLDRTVGIDAGAERMESVWDQTFWIMTITDHPDLTVYYYHICKALLIRARPFFKDNGVLDTNFRGRDLAPDPRYIPAHLFVRQLTLTTKKSEEVVGIKEPRAFTVSGAHVDDGATTPEELGGTTAGVTISGGMFDEDEEG